MGLPTLLGKYSPGLVLKNEATISRFSRTDGAGRLNLAEAVDAPADLGVYGVPSAGSVGHYLGLCKPCDFVHRGSCRIGVACQFCHLCGPGEAQRRKKEKKQLVRMVESFQYGIVLSQTSASRSAP